MRVSTLVAFSESGAAADDGFSKKYIIILVSGSVAQSFSATFKYVFRYLGWFHNYRTNDEKSSTLYPVCKNDKNLADELLIRI